jgi:hypothetical protein
VVAKYLRGRVEEREENVDTKRGTGLGLYPQERAIFNASDALKI